MVNRCDLIRSLIGRGWFSVEARWKVLCSCGVGIL